MTGLVGEIQFESSQEVECPVGGGLYNHQVTSSAPPGRFIHNAAVTEDDHSCGVKWHWPEGSDAQVKDSIVMAVPDGLSIEATRITVSDTVFTNLEWLELNATDSLYFENAGLAHGSSNASDTALVSDAKSWPVTWAYAPLIVVAGNSYISNFTAIAENVSVIEGELTTGSSSFYSRSLVI